MDGVTPASLRRSLGYGGGSRLQCAAHRRREVGPAERLRHEGHTVVETGTADRTVVHDESIDIVVECIGGVVTSWPLIAAALAAGKYVVSGGAAAGR